MEHLVAILQQAGMDCLWDQHLHPGENFDNEIKLYIEHADVFAPVISSHSKNRDWVHAEIGYALAFRIPVIPITIDTTPSGIIERIQAISMPQFTDRTHFLADAEKKLTGAINHLIRTRPLQAALFECTEDNVRRAELLARYALTVTSIGYYGRIRQKASLTSFHVPDRPPTDAIWKTYYGGDSWHDNRLVHERVRAERLILEEHARNAGCRLIIDSVQRCEKVYLKYGPASARAQIQGLLEFLEHGMVQDVQIAVNVDEERKSSITIIGDWCSSEAISSKEVSNLRQAIFTRNAATVRRQIKDFDDEFDRLLAARNWDAAKSREEAIQYLKEYLER